MDFEEVKRRVQKENGDDVEEGDYDEEIDSELYG